MKRLGLFAVVLLFGATFLAANVLAAESVHNRWSKEYSLDDIQGTVVKNQSGERLGAIRDVVVDSRGQVSFAIIGGGAPSLETYPLGAEWLWGLGIGEKSIAVPFAALNLDHPGNVLLNATREQLESAPAYQAGDLSDTKRAENVYRFFGQQPYWSEEACR